MGKGIKRKIDIVKCYYRQPAKKKIAFDESPFKQICGRHHSEKQECWVCEILLPEKKREYNKDNRYQPYFLPDKD